MMIATLFLVSRRVDEYISGQLGFGRYVSMYLYLNLPLSKRHLAEFGDQFLLASLPLHTCVFLSD